MNDTETRLNDLFSYSNKVYAAIDQMIDGEHLHRAMLRMSILAAAHSLRDGITPQTINQAGEMIHSILATHLRRNGVTDQDLSAWPNYTLPSEESLDIPYDSRIDKLAELYADTTRVTRDRNDNFETDSSHAIHLATLSAAYISEFHSELRLNLALIYALLHDIVEAYCGDTASFGISDEGQTKKDEIEAAALRRIKSEFQDDFPGFVQIIENYEHLTDPEARFIKTFDKLDPGYTWLYSKPREMLMNLPHITSREILSKFRIEAANKVAKHGDGFPDLIRLYFEMSRSVDAHIRLPDESEDFRPDLSDIDALELQVLSRLGA